MTTDALTIHESAETTGWSPRMLRYIERSGLVVPARSASGYRLYGAAELQRLRTLRELLARFELGLSDIVFALRLGRDDRLRDAVDQWLEAKPRRPEHVAAGDWLGWEQHKHEKLVAAAAAPPVNSAAPQINPAAPPVNSAAPQINPATSPVNPSTPPINATEPTGGRIQ